LVEAWHSAHVVPGINICTEVPQSTKCPTVLVPGNNESMEELTFACKSWRNAHVLHGSKTEIDGVTFFGLGAGVPVTPFGAWSFDLTEDEARRLLSTCPQRAVLVTHSPPRGAVDVSSSGKSLGSVAVAEAIQRTKAMLVVCGHIHESAGQTEYIGQSPVVNAGPDGVLWELDV